MCDVGSSDNVRDYRGDIAKSKNAAAEISLQNCYQIVMKRSIIVPLFYCRLN
jgi:hypothetical protein